MKKTTHIALIATLFFACKSKTNQTEASKKNNKDSTELHYPIAQYVQGQLAYIESSLFVPEKLTYINNKLVDSVLINKATLQALATDFMQPDLNDAKIKNLFTENKFQDLTINTLTFNYTTTDPTQTLQQADVLLDPETKKVRTLLFRKTIHNADTLVLLNGFWKHNKNFQLNYTIQPGHGPMQTKQVKVIWDKTAN